MTRTLSTRTQQFQKMCTRTCTRLSTATGAVFVNQTAVYDTVWHRGLTRKLLRLLSDKCIVRMIKELVLNKSFTLTTDDSKPIASYDVRKMAFLKDRSWSPSFQRLPVQSASHHLHEVHSCCRPGDTSLIWKVEEVGKDSCPGHVYFLCAPPHLLTKAQPC